MNYEKMIKSRKRIHKAIQFVELLMLFQICIGLGYCAYAGVVLSSIDQVIAGAIIAVIGVLINSILNAAAMSNIRIISQLEDLQRGMDKYEI